MPAAAAVVALGLLAVLATTGGPLGLRNFVPFRSRGVMTAEPAGVTRLEVRTPARHLLFVRDGGRWRAADATTPPAGITPAQSRLDAALGFLHDSAPIRTLSRADYTAADLRDFGLDPPGCAVTLFAGSAAFRVEFGAPNPMRSAQYARVPGRDEVYLLPRFVGREWELVASSEERG